MTGGVDLRKLGVGLGANRQLMGKGEVVAKWSEKWWTWCVYAAGCSARVIG